MNMDEPGFKTHMNDIQATMGIVGVSHNKEILEHRCQLADIYFDKFTQIPVVADGSYWLFCILLENSHIYFCEFLLLYLQINS